MEKPKLTSQHRKMVQDFLSANLDMEHFLVSRIAEHLFEWRKWQTEIPYIPFKENWEVKLIPPHTGAIVRFLVREKGKEQPHISVYLDCYDLLGYFREPYWEVYPVDGDTFRCAMKDIQELLHAIELGLKGAEHGNA